MRLLCDTLQNIYQGNLYGEDGRPLKKLMINMPPQHGKSRTLVNFSIWVFGLNTSEKIITASYNDLTASDFGRYTRDAITAIKNESDQIVYSDIFPNTKIKKGNGGHERWALEGQHFSYISAGVGGSITSKGGTVNIIDDPVKGAIEALNDNLQEKIWTWYIGTFLSRTSAIGGEPIEIINMTRWSKRDICGRILADDVEKKDWHVLTMKAYEAETDSMLCDEILSKKRYFDLKRKMDQGIFGANYSQEPIDIKGVLFPANELNYFKPSEVTTKSFESSIAYSDVADEGSDNLASLVGRNIKERIYIVDVVFSRENTDITLPLNAHLINENDVAYCRVESNAMGAMFARNLQKLVPSCTVLTAHSTANKHTRILMDTGFIKKYFYFVHQDYQSDEYTRFMSELCSYSKEGKSKHDDAPDAASGLAIFIRSMLNEYY